MALAAFVAPIFKPLLSLSAFWIILIFSLGVTLVITLAYKFLTDQKLMKQLRDELKSHQKKFKDHKNDPEKLMKLQKDSMDANWKYMKESFKPTLYTLLPLLVIFAWLSAYVAYDPINPGDTFTVTAEFTESSGFAELEAIPDGVSVTEKRKEIFDNKAVWTLKAEKIGDYTLTVNQKNYSVSKELLISDLQEYSPVEQKYKDSPVKKVKINNSPVRPFGSLNLFGWEPGWLAAYIIFSILFSTILRKLLNIY